MLNRHAVALKKHIHTGSNGCWSAGLSRILQARAATRLPVLAENRITCVPARIDGPRQSADWHVELAHEIRIEFAQARKLLNKRAPGGLTELLERSLRDLRTRIPIDTLLRFTHSHLRKDAFRSRRLTELYDVRGEPLDQGLTLQIDRWQPIGRRLTFRTVERLWDLQPLLTHAGPPLLLASRKNLRITGHRKRRNWKWRRNQRGRKLWPQAILFWQCLGQRLRRNQAKRRAEHKTPSESKTLRLTGTWRETSHCTHPDSR